MLGGERRPFHTAVMRHDTCVPLPGQPTLKTNGDPAAPVAVGLVSCPLSSPKTLNGAVAPESVYAWNT